MFGYFKSQRRILGIVMLILACLFTGLWVKSLSIGTEIAFGRNAKDVDADFKRFYNVETKGAYSSDIVTQTFQQLISKDGFLTWRKITIENPDWLLGYPTGWRDTNYDAFKMLNQHVSRWLFCGFDFGECFEGEAKNVTRVGFDPKKPQSDPGLRLSYWQIPYWGIVLPMTLLSGWLLISKSKKNTINRPEIEPSLSIAN